MIFTRPVVVTLQKQIEPVADLLKSNFNRILWSNNNLVDRNSKQADTCSAQESSEGVLNHSLSQFLCADGTPDTRAACVHVASMQLDFIGISQPKVHDTFVGSRHKMIEAAFEYGDPGQDEVSFFRVSNGAGIINV